MNVPRRGYNFGKLSMAIVPDRSSAHWHWFAFLPETASRLLRDGKVMS
jgi:hypothetical protein